MAGNGGGGGSGSGGAASIMAAAAAVGSAESRFPSRLEQRNRWGSRGCWGGLSCFGSDKRTKRIVPSSRIPDGNAATVSGNGSQPAGLSNQSTSLTPLLAPPSSPASFTNSSLPSTAQSPNCFHSMSDNSPGEPSSTMFVTGPYAHETQLVSPPVFSAFTTEPSTAPLTPPPELAHLTTPSSPDVPYAHYLSSSMDFRSVGKVNNMVVGNDLQATYPLYPGSPSSSLISPASGTPRTGVSSPFPEPETPFQWDVLASSQDTPYTRNGSSKLFGRGASNSKNFMLSLDSSFFYPASSAQFHLDQAQQPHPSHAPGGRLSISKDGDTYTNDGNRHSKTCKQDVEVLEAYRASFGFSADELITTPSYVEISDEVDISFSVPPLPNNNKQSAGQCPVDDMLERGGKETIPSGSLDLKKSKLIMHEDANELDGTVPETSDKCPGDSLSHGNRHASTDDIIFSKMWNTGGSKSFHSGLSNSDTEIDYRRSRSLKDSIMAS